MPLTHFSPPKQKFDLHTFFFVCVAEVLEPECAVSVWGWSDRDRVIKFPRLGPGHASKDFCVQGKTIFLPKALMDSATQLQESCHSIPTGLLLSLIQFTFP
jgi:hypothetical protein